ncbi:MAG: CheR family methyltransferase [Usitatibacteraceae bacterium]
MKTESLRESGNTGSGGEKVREFAFNDRDFERICKLIYQHAGISLSPQKRDMVYSRVARRVRALELNSFDAYLTHLDKSGPDEWQAFTNSLTTNLTSFFREGHHFPVLAEHVAKLKHRPIKIWCAAASTGEEPYSLAITMAELLGNKAPVKILASDVDTNVLEQAARGDYAMERVEKMERARLERFFLCGSGVNEGRVKVRQDLRDMISFQRINLLDNDWKINGPFDAIFCRNVMIYFDKPTQSRILERFALLLRPDGLLFAGHSESLFHVSHLFQLRGKTVYSLLPRGNVKASA